MRSALSGTLRPDGRWQITVTLTRADGAKVRKTFYAATQRDVQEKARALIGSTNRQEPLTSTVADLIEEMWRSEWPRRRKSSQDKYRWACDKYLLPRFGSTRLADLKPPTIARWLKSLAARVDEHGRSLSGASIQGIYNVLRAAMSYAVAYGMAESNPTREVRLPVSAKPKPRPRLTPEALRRIIAAELNPTFATLWVTLAVTGLRPHEAFALRGRDVVMEGGAHWLSVRGSKTDAGVRNVPIPEQLASRLQTESPGDLVFATANGTAFDRTNVGRAWRGTQRRVNEREKWDAIGEGREAQYIEPTNLYQLRKYALSALFAAGVAEDVIKELAGHTDIRLTQNVYNRVAPSRILSEVSRVGLSKSLSDGSD